MANTTNLNLVKLSGSEKLKTYPTNQAGNMDTIDSAFGAGFGLSGKPSVNTSLNNLADGLAIIANGNTHAAITSGQFVYVRNHGSLSEGLYTATTNISANGTLSGSNLTADTNGGLNSVYSALNDQIGTLITTSYSNPGNDGRGGYFQFGPAARICYGHNVIPDSGAVTISFPIQMDHVPVVVAQWSTGTNTNIAGDIGALKIYRVSTTNFTATVGGNLPEVAKGGNLFVSWIAIAS